MNEYEFSIKYYDSEGRFLDSETLTVKAEDRDEAGDKAENYAEVEADYNDFDSWEITLIDVH